MIAIKENEMRSFRPYKPRPTLTADQKAERAAAKAAAERKCKTCQICGRPIFAELGTVAHHGYRRPGDGYQTSSCMGAKKLPYETDRAALGHHIEALKMALVHLAAKKARIDNEEIPIFREENRHDYERRADRARPLEVAIFTRESLAGAVAACPRVFTMMNGWKNKTFDQFKAEEVRGVEREETATLHDLQHQERRYAEWKLTHVFRGGLWEEAK